MKIFVCSIVFKFVSDATWVSYIGFSDKSKEDSLNGAVNRAFQDKEFLTSLIVSKCPDYKDCDAQVNLALAPPDVASACDSIQLLQMIKGMQVIEHYMVSDSCTR